MPDINDYLKKKSPKSGTKKSDWDISSIISGPKIEPTRPQRRPGRGEDSPLSLTKVSDNQVTNALNKEVAESAYKPDTKLDQSSDNPTTGPQKTGHELNTNRTQSEHKPSTNRTQNNYSSKVRVAPLSETGHKPDTQPDTKRDTNRTRTEHKPDTKQGFSSLVGLQREITIFLYTSCKTARARITEPLSLEHIASSLNIRIGSVKTTLRRLEEKIILQRVGFKNGRGGWSRYELSDTIYRELLQLETEHKLNTNRTQTEHKLDTQPDTEPDTRRPSSSSSIELDNFKNTTSDTEIERTATQLTPEWQQVDYGPLTDIGFTQTHLAQIIRQGLLAPSEVQDSIHFFAFDLHRNGKGKELNGSPLNFFMGIVRKGIPYAPPENYESLADEARRKTREFKERKERERKAEEQRIFDLEFSEWRRGLASDALAKILPNFARSPGPLQDSALRSYFEESVWPERQAAALGLPILNRDQIQREIRDSLQEAIIP